VDFLKFFVPSISPRIQDPANVIWAHYVIELDLKQWPPIVYELTNDPGVLILSSKNFATNWLSLATWRRTPYVSGFTEYVKTLEVTYWTK